MGAALIKEGLREERSKAKKEHHEERKERIAGICECVGTPPGAPVER